MSDPTMDEDLRIACDEDQLDPAYRDIVRPLLRDGAVYPRCCGGGCEPCAEQLIRIANRVKELRSARAKA